MTIDRTDLKGIKSSIPLWVRRNCEEIMKSEEFSRFTFETGYSSHCDDYPEFHCRIITWIKGKNIDRIYDIVEFNNEKLYNKLFNKT